MQPTSNHLITKSICHWMWLISWIKFSDTDWSLRLFKTSRQIYGSKNSNDVFTRILSGTRHSPVPREQFVYNSCNALTVCPKTLHLHWKLGWMHENFRKEESPVRKISQIREDQKFIVRSPFWVKHHVIVQCMAAGLKCPQTTPPARGRTPRWDPPLEAGPPPCGQHDWWKTTRIRKNQWIRKNWPHYCCRKGLCTAVALSTASCYNQCSKNYLHQCPLYKVSKCLPSIWGSGVNVCCSLGLSVDITIWLKDRSWMNSQSALPGDLWLKIAYLLPVTVEAVLPHSWWLSETVGCWLKHTPGIELCWAVPFNTMKKKKMFHTCHIAQLCFCEVAWPSALEQLCWCFDMARGGTFGHAPGFLPRDSLFQLETHNIHQNWPFWDIAVMVVIMCMWKASVCPSISSISATAVSRSRQPVWPASAWLLAMQVFFSWCTTCLKPANFHQELRWAWVKMFVHQIQEGGQTICSTLSLLNHAFNTSTLPKMWSGIPDIQSTPEIKAHNYSQKKLWSWRKVKNKRT